jgi:hypothetical protein
MTTAIVLALLAGIALSHYFAWPALIWASGAVLLFTSVSEIANGSSVGFTLLWVVVNLTVLQAGYLGGVIVQHSRAASGKATIKDDVPQNDAISRAPKLAIELRAESDEKLF